jgi:hypothetical protein
MNIKNAKCLKTIEKLPISLNKKHDRQKSNENIEITHSFNEGTMSVSFLQTCILSKSQFQRLEKRLALCLLCDSKHPRHKTSYRERTKSLTYLTDLLSG